MQNLNSFKGIKSSELRGFFTGLILGDATIDKGVRARALRIKLTNKEFIDMISTIVKNNTPFTHYILEKPERVGSDGVHHKAYWEFVIKAHPYFNKLYHFFYNDIRHRVVYSKNLNWLNPIGLACWYMSDGYVCLVGKTKGFIRDRRIDICTDRYYVEDIELMRQVLKNKFDLNTSLIKRGKFYRIRILKDSYEKFINITSPYIVPSMSYKLYLGYQNKPDNLSDNGWEYQKYLQSALTQTGNAVG